jgi:beta-N-acetylhexosaminidase
MRYGRVSHVELILGHSIMPRFRTIAALLVATACAPAAPTGRPNIALPTPPPPSPIREPNAWVEHTLGSLTLRQKAGQLVMPRISGDYLALNTPQYHRLQDWVKTLGIGGVIITIGPIYEQAAKLNLLQSLAPIPLLVSADMEHGPGQVLQSGVILPYGLDNGSATRFPPIMALGAAGDEKHAFELGRITAIEGRAAGIHINFAPVVDVNNNPANPIINTRSYGEDPELVSRLSAANIRGMQSNGMLATAKHFPGHGDTGTDSHIDLPVITVDKARADRMELPPYRSAIETGVSAIMTAHIAFPALTGDSLPATLNPRILTGLLRDELKFQGIVFTDAMDMGAIVKNYGNTRASVMALKAGADVLLQPLPQDVAAIIDAVVQAVEAGEIPLERIDASVRKVLEAKAKLNLHLERVVDFNKIPATIGIPEHLAAADAAAEASITAVRDRDGLLPISGDRIISIVYADDYDPYAGRIFQRALAASKPGTRQLLIDSRVSPARLDSIYAMLDRDAVVLFSPFIRVSANKGDVAVAPHVADFVKRIAGSHRLVVTSFGNPYALTQFPEVGTYVIAWGQWDVSQRAAARALIGQISITGKLPIAIPPLHRIGEGVQIKANVGGRE